MKNELRVHLAHSYDGVVYLNILKMNASILENLPYKYNLNLEINFHAAYIEKKIYIF
jgi:hypothetical protein